MPTIPLLQTSHADSRIVESRQAIPAVQSQVQQPHMLLPPSSPEDLTLRLLGIRSIVQQDSPEYNDLVARQSSDGVYAIQLQYQTAGPAPGAVVGIVLGSVGGFLILIWLLWAISNGSGSFIRTTGELEEVESARPRSRAKRARSRRTEMQQSRSGSSPRRVYRSERVVREFPPAISRSPSAARDRDRDRDRSRARETIIIEESRTERRVDGDDIIEVMEEHDSVDVPRRKNRRQSDRSVIVEQRVSEDDRPSSRGYRTVDPRQFGGGSFRPHRI